MLEIGGSLREARQRRGLDLTEVEAATMIRARYLEALEEERFEVLPPGAYRRSFLREYAEFLGLDGDVYTGEYDLRLAPPEPEPLGPAPGPGRVTGLLDRLPVNRTSAAFAGVVAVLGVGVWLLGSSGGTGTTTVNRPATTAAAALPTTTTRTPTHPRPAAVAPTTTTRPAPHRAPPPLVLTAARGDCWLQVRTGSGTGRVVFERTLRQGQTVRFGLRSPLWIRVGAPSNLDVAIGSRDVTATLPRRTGNVLASASGLRPTT